jgi:hypothetical protein
MIDIVIYRDNNTVEFGLVKAEKNVAAVIRQRRGRSLHGVDHGARL